MAGEGCRATYYVAFSVAFSVGQRYSAANTNIPARKRIPGASSGLAPEIVSTNTSDQPIPGLISSSNSKLCLKCSTTPSRLEAHETIITVFTVIKAHFVRLKRQKVNADKANPETAKGTHCIVLPVCSDNASSIGTKQNVPEATTNKNRRYQDSICSLLELFLTCGFLSEVITGKLLHYSIVCNRNNVV